MKYKCTIFSIHHICIWDHLKDAMNKVRVASFVATPMISTTEDSAKKMNAASKSSTMKGCQTMSTLKTNQVSFIYAIGIELT